MKNRSIAIIIDPWEPQTFLAKVFYLLSDQFKLFRNVRKLVEDQFKDINTVIIAAYDNIPAVKDYQHLPAEKIYTTDIDTVISFIRKNNIKKIYFCGMAWDRCVKDRELGFVNLYRLLKDLDITFLVKDDCVICSSEYNFEIFNPKNPINYNWKKTKDPRVYKYNPNE